MSCGLQKTNLTSSLRIFSSCSTTLRTNGSHFATLSVRVSLSGSLRSVVVARGEAAGALGGVISPVTGVAMQFLYTVVGTIRPNRNRPTGVALAKRRQRVQF